MTAPALLVGFRCIGGANSLVARSRNWRGEFGRENLAEAVAAWEDPTRWPHELQGFRLPLRATWRRRSAPRNGCGRLSRAPCSRRISTSVWRSEKHCAGTSASSQRGENRRDGGGLAACPLVNRRRGQGRFELVGCKDGSDERHRTSQHLARGSTPDRHSFDVTGTSQQLFCLITVARISAPRAAGN